MSMGLFGWEIDNYGFCWCKKHTIRNAFRTYLSVSIQCLKKKSHEHRCSHNISKTSLVDHVCRQLDGNDLITVRFDIFDCKSEYDFYIILAAVQ